MSVIIDVSGGTRDGIRFASSPLAELGAMLHVLAEPTHHPALTHWAASVVRQLPVDLAGRLAEADTLWRSARSDLLLPNAPGADLATELDRLDELDDEHFVTAALEGPCAAASTRGMSGPAPLSEPAERQRMLRLAVTRGLRHSAFAERLLEDPKSVRAWLRRLLEDCDTAFFAQSWHDVRGQLAADVRHKSELLKHHGLASALADISPAVSMDTTHDRVMVDTLHEGRATAPPAGSGLGLVLVPTAFGWPHVVVRDGHGGPAVLQYPVTGPRESATLSVEHVLRRLDAVAHPGRLRLCRVLARGPHTTGELAHMCDSSSPVVSRHLAVLRRAGLVRTRREGRYAVHELDLRTTARLGGDLLSNVLR